MSSNKPDKVLEKNSELDTEAGSTEGTGEIDHDVYGPYYEEAKRLHEMNPEWYPNPDGSIIVKGKELKEARAEYEALVRRGNLRKVIMFRGYHSAERMKALI